MRTIADIDAAALAFATTLINRAEAGLGRQFDADIRTTVRNAIVVGYRQGVIDEREQLLNGKGGWKK